MSDVFKKAPDNLKKAFVSGNSGNIVTCMGRMMFPNIVTPGFPSKTEKDSFKKQWQIQLLIPDGADIQVLRDRVDELAADNLTKAQKASGAKWKNPIKDTAKEATFAAYADEYPFLIGANAKCFQKDKKPRPAPDVVLPNGKKMPDVDEAEDCYPGRWCRISLNPYWYDVENMGVSLGLVNVQLLYNDDPLSGGKVSADREFEAVGDGLDDLENGGDFE